MRKHSRQFGFVKCQSIVVAAVLALLVSFTGFGPARASDDGVLPVEEFSKELNQLKHSFAELSKKIDESVKTIDDLSDVEKGRAEIEQLRIAVSSLLTAVADNGAVAKLGVKAEQHVEAKLKSLERETRFKPQERQFLIDQWRRIQAETRTASQELGAARNEFADLLRILQGNEDYIGELIQIRQAKKAIDVLRQVTAEIRDASGKLKRLIGGIKTPGV